jgi:hypothetical protein
MTDLPPEKEKEYEFGAPEGSPNFVFIPSAGTDTIVKVHGQTRNVTLIEVGDRPRVLKVVPGRDEAVVLNAGSDDVSIVRSTVDADDVVFVPVVPHCNAIAIDPAGRFAIVWYDHARAGTGDPVGSFQTVSVVRLEAGAEEAFSVSTGFRTRAVFFTKDGARALLVTDDGVGVLAFDDLVQDAIVPPVPVTNDPLDKPEEREVVATPDGKWAVIRATAKQGVTLVDLEAGTLFEVPLSAVPTDLDLLPDGSAALAVLRDTKEVALIPLPGAAADPASVKVASTGSLLAGLARLTDDGKTAVLYTSLLGVEEVATLDVATMKVKPVLLRKTVDYVVVPAGSRRALLVHRAAATATTDPTEQFVDGSEGYTLFDLDTGFTKLVLTPFRPSEIAMSGDPAKAYVLLPDPYGVDHAVQEAHLGTFMTRDFALGSTPQHVRVLDSAGVAAVTQDHPSGRITFIDTGSGASKTVTGFELNGAVQ